MSDRGTFCKLDKRTAKSKMRHILNNNDDYGCIDKQTDEVNCTKLAETTADMLDFSGVLDDPDHPIWDWAVDISDEYDKK